MSTFLSYWATLFTFGLWTGSVKSFLSRYIGRHHPLSGRRRKKTKIEARRRLLPKKEEKRREEGRRAGNAAVLLLAVAAAGSRPWIFLYSR